MTTMPTIAAWVDAWQALSVTGVKRVYPTPPLSLNTADLPATWPELPDDSLDTLLVSCIGENERYGMTYQLAIEPVGQNTQAGNYEAVIPLFDYLRAAIKAMTITNFIDFNIRMVADIVIADVPHWGLRVTAIGSNVR